MIKAVIFDFSGVIVSRINVISKNLETELNIGSKEIHETMKKNYFNQFLEGKISEKEYWEILINKNNWNISTKRLKEIARDSFKEIKGTLEIVKELKRNKIKLGILSSHTKEWVEFLRKKINYEIYFDEVLYSYQSGKTKPEIEFYKEILKKLEVSPQDCIYIDDKEKYLIPAKELGMKTFLFKNPDQLKQDLTYLKLI